MNILSQYDILKSLNFSAQKMYQSKELISEKTKQVNLSRISKHISQNPKLERCRALKRKIFLEKYLDANKKRSDAFIRFSCFFVALDILKKTPEYEEKNIDGFRCFEIKGYTKNNEIVTAHIREEEKSGDKKLFLISTFYKK